MFRKLAICPAPTTPNLLTSAAAESLGLLLSDLLLTLLAMLLICRPASKGEDMIACLTMFRAAGGK